MTSASRRSLRQYGERDTGLTSRDKDRKDSAAGKTAEESGVEDSRKDIWNKYGKKRRLSLSFKYAVVVVAAAFFAVVLLNVMGLLEDVISDKYIANDKAKKSYLDSRYDSLEKFIKENRVKGTDANKLQVWLSDKEYTVLIVRDKDQTIFTGGWQANSSGRLGSETSNSSVYNDSFIRDLSIQSQDMYNRKVKFYDGKYNIYINVFLENRWYDIMDMISIVISAFVFIMIILLYNKKVLKRIGKLSEQVLLISEGDLRHDITPGNKDEIGDLAKNVNDMRNSILEKASSEKAAWDANRELITSMSHDIRTPLTSLIGYLDIISGRKFKSMEELDKYIDSCKYKAIQLKDLSDKMFQYFLVFGNQMPDQNMEVLDAGILLQQLMIEHEAEMISNGFNVDLDFTVAEGTMIRTDVSAMQRIFDNLFSNMMKYADKNFVIRISASVSDGLIKMRFQNRTAPKANKVESTKIGVKTCKKICEDLKGTFLEKDDKKTYITEITFPVDKSEEPPA